jgi:hypothetical protein
LKRIVNKLLHAGSVSVKSNLNHWFLVQQL